VLNAIPHIGKLLEATLDEMLAKCEHVILAQKPTPEAVTKIEKCGLPVLDVVSGRHG
jgi:GDP-mannose 6-dehydrogenase